MGRLFYVSYTVEGIWLLVKRHRWSWQRPARRDIKTLLVLVVLRSGCAGILLWCC
ncbi:winged helix-turn-helix domain-containing protein [Streptomyces sp. NPDC059215]|uniref:winged helix-turn-helix domain-containing protein n=1 Tax=Streptomyces sp. NPDC059215 TaxID=3346772 RepID=UPI0036A2C261